MTFFALLNQKKLALQPGKKILKAKDFVHLVEAEQLIETLEAEAVQYKERAVKRGEKKGVKEGLKQFAQALASLEAEKAKVRKEMEASMIPLTIAAVKKIIGKEMDAKNASIIDIIGTALKNISHHKKVKLYVNKADLELIETEKAYLKDLFENLQSFSISARDDVPKDGCIIETEAGILHVSLEHQIAALEKAFKAFLPKEKSA